MCQLLETIQIRDRQIVHLDQHQKRVERSFQQLWPQNIPHQLHKLLQIPADLPQGTLKLRVIYDQTSISWEFSPYCLRQIKSLKLVESLPFDYAHKYLCREHLNQLHAQRGPADDVLIVINNLLTDTSIANIILWDEKRWWTPAEPLLLGSCRARLLEEKKIFSRKIYRDELQTFKAFATINAMRPEESLFQPHGINHIIY